MENREFEELKSAFLECAPMRSRTGRDVIISGLSRGLQEKIERDDDEDMDITNLIVACIRKSDYMEELIEMVHYFEGDSPRIDRIGKIWLNIKPPVSRIIRFLLAIAGIWLLLVIYAVASHSVDYSLLEIILAISPTVALLGAVLWVVIDMAREPEEEGEEEEEGDEIGEEGIIDEELPAVEEIE